MKTFIGYIGNCKNITVELEEETGELGLEEDLAFIKANRKVIVSDSDPASVEFMERAHGFTEKMYPGFLSSLFEAWDAEEKLKK